MKAVLLSNDHVDAYEAGLQRALRLGMKFLDEHKDYTPKFEVTENEGLLKSFTYAAVGPAVDTGNELATILKRTGMTSLMIVCILTHLAGIKEVGFDEWIATGIINNRPVIKDLTDEQIDAALKQGVAEFVATLPEKPLFKNVMDEHRKVMEMEAALGICKQNECAMLDGDKCTIMGILDTVMLYITTEIEATFGSYETYVELEKKMAAQAKAGNKPSSRNKPSGSRFFEDSPNNADNMK